MSTTLIDQACQLYDEACRLRAEGKLARAQAAAKRSLELFEKAEEPRRRSELAKT